jgi:hypothetical protein
LLLDVSDLLTDDTVVLCEVEEVVSLLLCEEDEVTVVSLSLCEVDEVTVVSLSLWEDYDVFVMASADEAVVRDVVFVVGSETEELLSLLSEKLELFEQAVIQFRAVIMHITLIIILFFIVCLRFLRILSFRYSILLCHCKVNNHHIIQHSAQIYRS